MVRFKWGFQRGVTTCGGSEPAVTAEGMADDISDVSTSPLQPSGDSHLVRLLLNVVPSQRADLHFASRQPRPRSFEYFTLPRPIVRINAVDAEAVIDGL